MQGYSKTLVGSLAMVVICATVAPGCHGTSRRTITGSTASSSGEPILDSEVAIPAPSARTSSGSRASATIIPGTSADSTIVEPAEPAAASSSAASSPALSWVDRHPLLRKPQQYYDNTNSNKLVKTASAAFVGVPAGIVGEIKQIVVGKPSATTY